METPGGIATTQAPGWLNRLQQRFWTGPPHPVARALVEGDEVAGFTVLESPGHSRGHVAYWRESDRVLILGDVLNNMNVMTGIAGLHEPPEVFTPDPPRNRALRAQAGRAAPAADLLRPRRPRCATPAGSPTSSRGCPTEPAMSESIFIADGERFVPTEHARGPWDRGRAARRRAGRADDGGVRAHRAGRRAADRAARLRVPAPDPVRAARAVDADRARGPARAGARGRAARGRGARLPGKRAARAAGTGGLPERPARAGAGAAADARPGRRHARCASRCDGSTAPSFGGTAMEMRWLGEHAALGPARVWMRLRHPLLPGEPLTPLARLAATADFGNGVSAALPFDRFLFINADLTIHLHRPPRGEWIGLDARTLLHAGGTGLAESVLHDSTAPSGARFRRSWSRRGKPRRRFARKYHAARRPRAPLACGRRQSAHALAWRPSGQEQTRCPATDPAVSRALANLPTWHVAASIRAHSSVEFQRQAPRACQHAAGSFGDFEGTLEIGRRRRARERQRGARQRRHAATP